MNWSSAEIRLDDLRRQFPTSGPVPPLLVQLLEWRNQWYGQNPDDDLRHYLSVDLYHNNDALEQWFGEESEYDTSQFAVVALDAEGSVYRLLARRG